MNEWVLAPLGVLAVSVAWVLFVNRKPRVGGLVWPDGVTLGGSTDTPDVAYDGNAVIGGVVELGAVRCRSLVIPRGADVTARRVECARLRVDGTLTVEETLIAARRIEVRGTLEADEAQSKCIVLRKGSRARVMVAPGAPRIDRHPEADVKGFFSARGELPHASATAAESPKKYDTQKIRLVE